MKAIRFILCLMLVVMLLGLAACGGDDETTTTAAAPSDTTATTGASSETTAPSETTATTAASGEVYQLTWASGLQSTSQTYNDLLLNWAKWVETKTDGRLKFDFQIDGASCRRPRSSTASQRGRRRGRPLHGSLRRPLPAERGRDRCRSCSATPRPPRPAPRPPSSRSTRSSRRSSPTPASSSWASCPWEPGQIHTTKKVVKTAADLKGMVLESHAGRVRCRSSEDPGRDSRADQPGRGLRRPGQGHRRGHHRRVRVHRQRWFRSRHQPLDRGRYVRSAWKPWS